MKSVPARGIPQPLLSIVVPCFNAMPYIKEALDVITKWPADEVEIIVQDGGSTDGTLDVVQGYGDRIKLESVPDRGQTDALNKGIHRSTGEYIGWLNADDLYMPDMWEKVRPLMSVPTGPDAIYGDYSTIYGDGSIMRRMQLSDFDWSTSFRYVLPVWSGATLWRSDVFSRFGYFDESLHYCMDAEFFLRVAGSIRTHYVPHELGRFRIHDASKTGSNPWQFYRESHDIRWRHAGNDWSSRARVLVGDVIRGVYYATKRVRESKLYSSIRRTHSY